MKYFYISSALCFTLFTAQAAAQVVACKDGNELRTAESTTPAEDFIFLGDGLVVHKKTNLMWMQCAAGQRFVNGSCGGRALNLRWVDALKYAEESNFYGFVDWRLPSESELISIKEEKCFNPSLNIMVFPDPVAGIYWTSMLYDDYSPGVWSIPYDFGLAYFTNDGYSYRLRLVRNY